MPESSRPIGKFSISGDEAYFVVMDVGERGGSRLAKRDRPYRDGTKIDKLGRKGRGWSVKTLYMNRWLDGEPGIPSDVVLYPDELNKMLMAVEIQETGDLQLPTRPSIRAVLEDYEWQESADQPDAAVVTWHFWEDNEDNVDLAVLSAATARSTIQSHADQTVFSVERAGGYSQLVEDFEKACSDLSDAIAAPGEMLEDVDMKTSRLVRSTTNLGRQAERTAAFGVNRMTQPESWATGRNLCAAADTGCRAADEKTGSRVVTILTGDSPSAIFDVALKYAQDPQELMDMNPMIEDFLSIPPRTRLRVFQR
jgi:prophage DNA circulation protein